MSYKSKPNLNTGTGSSTNSNGSSSSTNKYDYEEKEFFLKGSVVLCQHGFLGEEDTMNPLFDNLKNNVLRSFYNCEFCEGVIRTIDLSYKKDSIKEVVDKIKANPDHNVFVRTLFRDSKYGDVSDQAKELANMINQIRYYLPNIPIVLIGYSKGGVVNLKCAIDNPGLIDRIINVGTPHEDTFIQDIIQTIADAYKDKNKILGFIPNPLADLAIQGLTELLNLGVDALLNEKVTYMNLKEEWNKLSPKPKLTVIAAEAIEIEGNLNGDFVVPSESALAYGFDGVSERFLVDDDKVTIDLNVLRNNVVSDAALDILGNAVETITGVDIVGIVETIVDILFNMANNDFASCLKLAHCSLPIIQNKDFMLTHKTIGMRVLAGLNL